MQTKIIRDLKSVRMINIPPEPISEPQLTPHQQKHVLLVPKERAAPDDMQLSYSFALGCHSIGCNRPHLWYGAHFFAAQSRELA